jgi:hypothetical protein
MKNSKLSRREVAEILENFLDGSGGPWAWDDFTLGMSFDDAHLEEIRIRCAGLSSEFPSKNPHEFCNELGRDILRGYIRELKFSS